MRTFVAFLCLPVLILGQIDVWSWFNFSRLPSRCTLPQQPGYSRYPYYKGMTYWWFNTTSEQCEPFQYMGRRGNRNRFRTPLKCLNSCGCRLSQDPGYCPNNSTLPVTRYFYNSVFRFCMEFQYSGCGGNINNFYNFIECQIACGGSDFGFEL